MEVSEAIKCNAIKIKNKNPLMVVLRGTTVYGKINKPCQVNDPRLHMGLKQAADTNRYLAKKPD